VVTGSLEQLPPAVLAYLAAAIERSALWARWGRVEIEGSPRRRAAGLAAAGLERLILPMIEGEPKLKNIAKK